MTHDERQRRRLGREEVRERSPWWLMLAGWFATALYLSSLASAQIPPVPIRAVLGFPDVDKAFHLIFYGLLGVLLAGSAGSRIRWPWLVAVAGAVALADELFQMLNRTPELEDLFDWLVDVIGASAGVIAWRALLRRTASDPALRRAVSTLLLVLVALAFGFLIGYSWRWSAAGTVAGP